MRADHNPSPCDFSGCGPIGRSSPSEGEHRGSSSLPIPTASSSNGKTSDSGSENLGPIPNEAIKGSAV